MDYVQKSIFLTFFPCTSCILTHSGIANFSIRDKTSKSSWILLLLQHYFLLQSFASYSAIVLSPSLRYSQLTSCSMKKICSCTTLALSSLQNATQWMLQTAITLFLLNWLGWTWLCHRNKPHANLRA